jgi:hypothetical protein
MTSKQTSVLRTALGAGVFALAACACGLPSGCKLDTQGAGEYDIPCATAGDCSDDNPCTTDTCTPRGVCSFTVAPSLVPDDGNDCTRDSCDGPTAVHEPTNEGALCKDGATSGFCKAGDCVVACDEQTAATACDDKNPCTLDSCDLTSGRCVRVKLDNTATPGVSQTPGDCKRKVCLQGVPSEIVDDTDLPINTQCWEESCNNGTPSTVPSAVDAPCGWNNELKCDGSGKCVGCTNDDQCPRDDCNGGVCNVSGECELDPKPAGTPLPDGEQTPNDCQKKQCDGQGIPVSVADDNDLPTPDSNECTSDVCVGGVPLHPPRSKNTGCSQGGGSVCDGAGNCVECNDATQCDDPGDCATSACTSNHCSVTNKSEGTACGTSGVCDGAGTCVGCTKASDCPDPGDRAHPVCNANQCGTAPDAKDTSCANGKYCDGAGKCVQCTQASQCPQGDACHDAACTNNTCSLNPKQEGTACPTGVCNAAGSCVQCINAAGCNDPGECKSPVCNNGSCGAIDDAKNTQCGNGWVCNGAGACVECNTATQCSGGTICQPKACEGNTCKDAALAPSGTPCGPNRECDGSGACKLVNGQSCTSNAACSSGHCVDGVCCDSSCNGTCEACTAAKKGSGNDGTCGPIKSGTDPDDECNGSHVCDGNGACTK